MFNWLFGNKKQKQQEQEKKILSYLTLLSTPLVSGDSNDSTIISRLQKKHPEWSKPYIETLIRQYKRFLHSAANSNTELVPTKDVDEVWHEHILFTKDYFVNWKEYLGKLVHHNPEKLGENKDYSQSFEKTEQMISKKIIEKEKKVKLDSKKKASVKKKSTPTVYSSYSPVVDPVDCFLITDTILNHSHHHSAPDSHGHSEASHCSSGSSASHCSSSSSCSSSSCSSSSCGGGGD